MSEVWLMNLDYLENIPQWFEEQIQLDLVLSDDIDSLLSCALLKKIKGWKVKYFYNFEKCYASRELKNGFNERCWIDVAILNGEKAFDNHVSMVTIWDEWNTQMINPNLIANITNEDYAEKYAGSTALLIWSAYNLPLPTTEEGKMLLLCIDSAFKGHYFERFAEANQFYLCDMFDFGELYDVMERHDISEFYSMIEKYNLNETITIKDGKLHTNLDLKKIGELLGVDIELPGDSFLLWKEYEIMQEKINDYIQTSRDIANNIFTLAFTFRNSVRYSKVKQKERKKDEGWYKSFYGFAG
jgi:hypothetical protein